MSPRGIILTDSLTSQLIENVSIYRYARVTGVASPKLGSAACFLGAGEPASLICKMGWGQACLPVCQ